VEELNLIDVINAREGWMKAMGIRITVAEPDNVECEWDVDERHHQGYGIAHGGVHCGVVESLSSIGAALAAARNGQIVVGLENSTSFIRAVREGRLRGRAVPLTRGRKTQLWECRITDARDLLVAVGKVRLVCLEAEEGVGGGSAFVLQR